MYGFLPKRGKLFRANSNKVNRFCILLQESSHLQKPCNLAFGYRALLLDIINHFIFGECFDEFQGLNDRDFTSPLTRATYDYFDWTFWAIRNIPYAETILKCVPHHIRSRFSSRIPAAQCITDVYCVLTLAI